MWKGEVTDAMSLSNAIWRSVFIYFWYVNSNDFFFSSVLIGQKKNTKSKTQAAN